MDQIHEWKADGLIVRIKDHAPFLDVIAEQKNHKVEILLKYGDAYDNYAINIASHSSLAREKSHFGAMTALSR